MGLIDDWKEAILFGVGIITHTWAESVSIGIRL